jgi:hypothetical protein
MSRGVWQFFAAAALILLGATLTIIIQAAGQQPAYAAGTYAAGNSWGHPAVTATILPVSCTSLDAFTTTYQKVDDFGTFEVQSPSSLVEVTYDGRLGALTVDSTGVIFELRVDDQASTHGPARAIVKQTEVGNWGVPVSFTGIFTDLSRGTHTVSMWARGSHDGGTGAYVDPGCWSTDKFLVKEYTPFGSAFLPAISKE